MARLGEDDGRDPGCGPPQTVAGAVGVDEPVPTVEGDLHRHAQRPREARLRPVGHLL